LLAWLPAWLLVLPWLLWTSLAMADSKALPPLPKIGIEGNDDRTPADSKDWPWISIGRINREIGGHCTGTLIAPDLVLTAAHCLYNANDGRWTAPFEIHFVSGYNRGSYAAHARGKSFVHDPAYIPGKAATITEMARDWAIIKLEKKLTLKPVPLADSTKEQVLAGKVPGVLNAAGYSGDYAELLMRHAGCAIEGMLAEHPVLIDDCDSTFGASGGPLLLIENGVARIIGVQSGVVQLKDKSERGVAVPVWSFKKSLPH
jgi:protease YdgD